MSNPLGSISDRTSSSSSSRNRGVVAPAARSGRAAKSKIVVPGNRGINVVRSVTILAPASTLYSFCREVANLKNIIRHAVTITPVSEVESHWTTWAKQGKGKELTWDVVIINDEPDGLIAWRSREGDPVVHAGSIRFEAAPGDEGTEVTVALQYDPPLGRIGAVVAWLNQESASLCVYDALRCLKALHEAGEIPTTRDQPKGGASAREEDAT